MNYYTEILKTKPNKKGRPRLYSDLGALAVCAGFDGDGTKGNATLRYWSTEKAVSPLPNGVVEISETKFNTLTAARDAAAPTPPPPTQWELNAKRRIELRAKDSLTSDEESEAIKLLL